MIKAPYRFVPLSSFVLLPDWAEQVSHDVPFKDGVCGELTIALKNNTLLCVGGNQTPASGQSPSEVHFSRSPDGEPAIPGSSLKGMLRNVLEIASFGRFGQVEDQKLGVRDISPAGKFYKDVMIKDVKAGWLEFADGVWSIRPCEFSRIHSDRLVEVVGCEKNSWEDCETAVERYNLIFEAKGFHNPEFAFNHEPIGLKKGFSIAEPNRNGICQGRLVVTGQPGNKKFDFVFHAVSSSQITVPSDVMSGFFQIHENGAEWQFWQEQLQSNVGLPLGIPVFFHKKQDTVSSLGLAMMYKLPYKHSLHDAIGHTQPAHLNESLVDLCDLVFGYLGDDERDGLRGRVNIGMALMPKPAVFSWTQATVLNSPKPTFYPAYIRQTGNSFRQLMEPQAELAGWKRYPVKKERILPPPDKSKPTVQVKLEVLPSGSEFTFPIRVHNLRPVELGALLWTLDFGGDASLRHSLGTGKPYGLGQVALSVRQCRLRHNDGRKGMDDMDFLTACRQEFRDLMNQALRKVGIDVDWERSAPLVALREFANPAKGGDGLVYMTNPDDFMSLRKVEHIQGFVDTFHKPAGLKPPGKDYHPETPLGYDSAFEKHLAEAPKARIEAEEKARRAELKEDASDEDKVILKLLDLMDQTKTNPTSSLLDKINKGLREAYDIWGALNETQEEQLRSLAREAQTLGNKRIGQICKKILG